MKDKHRLILLKRLLPIIILVICVIMSVGYTTVNYISLDVGGEVVAMEQEGLFIYDIKYKTGVDVYFANSNISVLNGTSLKHEIALSSTSNDSYITYVITVMNSNKYNCEFKGAIFDEEFYDNQDIVFDLNNSIIPGDLILSGETLDFEVTFKYREGAVASELNNVLKAYINYEFKPIAMLKSSTNGDATAFKSSAYKTNIKTINLENVINVPENVVASWDIGVSQTGDVMAYVVENVTDPSYYDLHIQADGNIYANYDMSSYFREMSSVEIINGIEYLDTRYVTNMSYMFAQFGKNASSVLLDLSNFDTSNVTDMKSMFYYCASEGTSFVLHLNNFDTSKVTNMSYMFTNAGYRSLDFTLDTLDFNTDKVTDMAYMFSGAGYTSSVFSVDVSSFNTSLVKNMKNMFHYAGVANPSFTLDVSGFDTSNVTNMSGMFRAAGCSNPSFLLDVSGFDTSKVTDMSGMFESAGKTSNIIVLDVSNFDTSNVTNMSNMFNSVGYNNLDFVLDVSHFNTSRVTDMSYMFSNVAYNSPTFVLDVSGFDTSKVTNMTSMFSGIGYKSTVFELDVSNFNTSNVTAMGSMFLSVGNSNRNFTLDVSNFDTSKVTNMQNMFRSVAINSDVFTLDISNFDTSKVTNMSAMFYYVAYYSKNFELVLGEFDTSSATNMISTFHCAGKSSSKLSFEVTIKNPALTSYTNVFSGLATVAGSRVVVRYTSETSDLVDLMIATKASDSNVFKDVVYTDVTNLKIGDVLTVAGDNFNVISVSDDTVTMLAQYNVANTFKQSSGASNFTFAATKEWTIVDGNMEIDVQLYTTNPKDIINGYLDLLRFATGENNISGDLITLKQLKELGCVINDDYVTGGDLTCANSEFASWLVNGQYWWTKSMFPANLSRVWLVYNVGTLNPIGYTDSRGIRPVITVPKSIFNAK